MQNVTLSARARAPSAEIGGTLTFDEVYRMHAQTVARWAARLAGPRGDVEDLTQEVFLVVNRRLADFRGDSLLSTWLFRITANVVANDRRRRAARPWWTRLVPGFAGPAGGERQLPSPAATPLEQIEQRERHDEFYEVLERLPDRYRRVLVLFELEELPAREIGEMLGQSEGSVRVVVHRARAAFLKELTRRRLAKEAR